MFKLLFSVISLLVLPARLRELTLENLALRQQLAVMKRQRPRPRLPGTDRWFWVCLARFWPNWRKSLLVVRPETVVSWHGRGFRLFWTWISRRRRPGRPGMSRELRDLVCKMAEANPLWGAPRIHGELLKLGIEVSERTVSRLMPKRRKPPSQSWRAFLANHVNELISIDFFTVPTATFRVLFVLVVLAHHRRRVLHFNVTEHPTALWPWQQAYVERLIGSIRRDCLNCVIILGERHLRAILKSYLHYYHRSRTHLALGKDAPEPRMVQPPELGGVWNCLRSAVSIIATSGERRSHLVLFGRLTPYASRRFGRRTNRSVVPPRRSHQRTSSSRSSPKGHQAGKISPPRSSGEPQVARMRAAL